MSTKLHSVRRVALVAVCTLLVPLAGNLGGANAATSAPVGYRAFSADSYWNTPLPANAPRHPNSAGIIGFLKADNVASGCPLLSGTGTNTWGMPIYWASDGDKTYDVKTRKYAVPSEFSALRIPAGAKPMVAADGEMVVYDVGRGTVAQLYNAVYDAATDIWTVGGGSIAYLASNGIDKRLAGTNDLRNQSAFRGYFGNSVAARYDEVQAGAVNHVIKVGVNTANSGFQFPMWGSDGSTTNVNAPIQGARIRIRPDVDLATYGLHPQALPIAKALQSHGMMVGDSTGAPVELKLEDTVQQGRGQLWNIANNALCAIPLDLYEVIDYGYRAPATSVTPSTPATLPAPTTIPAPATCAAPVNYRVIGTTRYTATVAWEPVNGATSYDVYYSVPPDAPSTPYATGFTGTTATLYGLVTGTTYNFAVRANCSSGGSVNSNVLSLKPGAEATTPTTAPSTTTTAPPWSSSQWIEWWQAVSRGTTGV